MLTLREGNLLVRIARNAVENFFGTKNLAKIKNKKLNEKHGVFVTIKKFPSEELRGCIGFISPITLCEAVQRAALCAAFKDPRFLPLNKSELKSVVFEVSVMTEPMLVDEKNLGELKKKIEIGCDGLIISNSECSGLLLPQVPVEQKWSADEFLENLCYKAGMTPDSINDENTKIWKFQCQIFVECKPNGKVEELELK